MSANRAETSLDGCEKSAGELVIPSCGGAEALELAEDALDEASFSVDGKVVVAFERAMGPG